MQLLPVSRGYHACLPHPFLRGASAFATGRKGHKPMCGNISTVWALLCLAYTRWTALGYGVFISLCGLDQVREGNAWKI